MTYYSTLIVAGASPSHPDAAGLKGAALRAPTASSPQMSGIVGAALDPDVEAEIEISHEVEPSSGFEVGLGVQPTQPPHSLLETGIHVTTSDVSGLAGGISGFTSTSGSMDVPESIHSGATRDDVTPGAGGPEARQIWVPSVVPYCRK